MRKDNLCTLFLLLSLYLYFQHVRRLPGMKQKAVPQQRVTAGTTVVRQSKDNRESIRTGKTGGRHVDGKQEQSEDVELVQDYSRSSQVFNMK